MRTPHPQHRLASPLLLLFVVAFAALATAGCGDFGSFTFEEESAEVVVEGGPLADLPINIFPALPLSVDLEQELAAQDASGASAVYLRDLRLVITPTEEPEGDSDDFDFVDEAEIYVESTDGSLPRELIATLDSVPSGVKEITFDVDSSIDLKPYAERGIRLTSRGEGSAPEDDTSLKAIATFDVEIL